MKQEADALFELANSSWAELEEELRRVLKCTARFGPRKSLRRIGENNGFMSVCCLLRPDWIGVTEGLPKSIVYKFSYKGGLVDLEENFVMMGQLNDKVVQKALMKSNNTEGVFYSLIDPEHANWLRIPRPYSHKRIIGSDDVGHLMMQYIEGMSFECHENNKVDEVKQILPSIARLQCLSVKDNLTSVDEFQWNPWVTIGQCVLTPKVARKVLSDIPAVYGDEFIPLINILLENMDEIYDLSTPMHELNEMSSVLVHGDIWQANTIWAYGKDRPRTLKVIVDWQSTHVGSPSEDLVFLLCCSLSGDDRRDHWQELLKELYDLITIEMAPGKPDFTLDEMIASWHRLFPSIGLVVLMRFSVIFKCSSPALPPDQREASSLQIARKLLYLAEDVVESFAKSRSIRYRNQ